MASSADDERYNRVKYVLGEQAMQKMAESSVLIVGLGGLGVEVAKNLILTGVGKVTVHDTQVVSPYDLGSSCFAKSVGEARVACLASLCNLNPTCDVSSAPDLIPKDVAQHSVVVLCDSSREILRTVEKHAKKIVWAEARGLLGCIFCNFGKSHVVVDATGVDPVKHVVVGIDKAEGVITVDDEAATTLAAGDSIEVQLVEGLEGINGMVLKIAEKKGFSFKIEGGLARFAGDYVRGGYIVEVKVPEELSFVAYDESVQSPEFLLELGADDPTPLHHAFRALHDWAEQHGRFPIVNSDADADEVAAKAAARGGADAARTLSRMASCSLNPVCTYIGGVASQEVLKACTGKYRPIQQWYYYDGLHALPADLPKEDCVESAPSRYASYIAIFGKTLVKRLQDLKYFIVGSGALGCELVKNFALMGLGTGPKGFVTITDPDKIERSNLSRQFLFRSNHIGDFKSKVAAGAAKGINKAMKIMAKTTKVCEETEGVFDTRFWQQQDGIVNALDNVQARLYVDGQCVQHRKPLIDSGTLGPQAHSQVVLPKLTESYGSSRDPVETDIPQCTLHFFPNTIEHTIMYARDWFGGFFTTTPESLQAYFADRTRWNEKIDNMEHGARLETIRTLHTAIKTAPVTARDCVEWSRGMFEELFTNFVRDLLTHYPLDKTDDKGVPFWSGKYKPPHELAFDPSNPEHLAFIRGAARLRAEVFNIPFAVSDEEVTKWALATTLLPYTPKEKLPGADDEPKPAEETDAEDAKRREDDAQWMEQALGEIDRWSAEKPLRITPIEFEKDDPTNGHIDFITSLSNLRAACYCIPRADVSETRRVAGRIVPAMITTTALITGLVSLELFKVHSLKPLPLTSFRNGWVNLAVPLFISSEPVPCRAEPFITPEGEGVSTATLEAHPLYGKTYTLWDVMEIPSKGDASLRQLFDAFYDKYKIEISQLATKQGVVVYSEFDPLHASEIFQDVGFKKPVTELVAKLTGKPAGRSVDFVVKGKAAGVYLGPLPTLRYRVV